MSVPVNVEAPVRWAQFLALIISLFSQDDLRIGFEGISKGLPHEFEWAGDGGDNEDYVAIQKMTSPQWYISYGLRLVQGFLGMVASFILIMQSNTVFDLLVNFLGVSFVQDLDGTSIHGPYLLSAHLCWSIKPVL